MGVDKNSLPSWRVLALGIRPLPPLLHCGEQSRVCFKRQVGRGRAAVEWGAADLPCVLCHVLPGYPGLALVPWWQREHLWA